MDYSSKPEKTRIAMISIEAKELKIGYRIGHSLQQVGPVIDAKALTSELVALIGPNGIGKSTLLKTIARLQLPISGKLCINGQPLNDIKNLAFSTITSFVSTEQVKAAHLTVHQLVALGRFPYTNWFGNLTKQDKEIISESIDLVNIKSLQDKPVDELSDGERQRAMIARAIAQDTQIILLDEPTAFLDIPNKHVIVHLLSRIAKEKQKTVVFTTHDLNIALNEADKIWLMDKDQLKEGAPEDLILNNAFSELFGNNLIFDWQSGIYKKIKTYTSSVAITGIKGNYYDLTIKALDRIGYKVETDVSRKIEITEDKGKITFTCKGFDREEHFMSIYELCGFLKGI
jgi:iron complex transport system ATP-binding protein